jgi:plastocyanin
MSNETIFFICGIILAVSAVTVALIGLKFKTFPGKAMPLVVLWFAVFVGASATFAVLHAKDEDKAHAAEYKEAGKKAEEEGGHVAPLGTEGAQGGNEAEAEEEAEAGEEAGPEEGEGGEGEAATGGEEALKLAASETELAFDTTELEAKAGKVTIDLDNPSSIAHNVAIEKEGKVLAESETLAEGETSATAELEPGTYTFLCTVPGHAEAGMEGTLTVK